MTNDQRKYFRINAQDDACVLSFAGTEVSGRLVNESIDGLRVHVSPSDRFSRIGAGESVSVMHDDQLIQAISVNLARCESGFTIGLLRDGAGQKTVESHPLLRDFVRLGDCCIVCKVLGTTADGRVKVSIPGGREFLVLSSQVARKTIGEREQDLDTDEALAKTVLFYGLLNSEDELTTPDEIVGYEFTTGF